MALEMPKMDELKEVLSQEQEGESRPKTSDDNGKVKKSLISKVDGSQRKSFQESSNSDDLDENDDQKLEKAL